MEVYIQGFIFVSLQLFIIQKLNKCILGWMVWFMFQQYFSYIVVVSFIGGGNWNARRKLLTCRKSLTNFRVNENASTIL
jgi:hypothetical protein